MAKLQKIPPARPYRELGYVRRIARLSIEDQLAMLAKRGVVDLMHDIYTEALRKKRDQVDILVQRPNLLFTISDNGVPTRVTVAAVDALFLSCSDLLSVANIFQKAGTVIYECETQREWRFPQDLAECGDRVFGNRNKSRLIKAREVLEEKVKENGEVRGRKPTLSAADLRLCKEMWKDRNCSKAEIARHFKLSIRSVERYMVKPFRGKPRAAILGDRK